VDELDDHQAHLIRMANQLVGLSELVLSPSAVDTCMKTASSYVERLQIIRRLVLEFSEPA